jgi:hypothetical protein
MEIFQYKRIMFDLTNILYITGAILGLVVVVNIFLGLLVSALGKITVKNTTLSEDNDIDAQPEYELFKKVAVAAVAMAIVLENETAPHEFPLPPTALVSAWQAVKRADVLKRHGRPR